MQNLQMMEASQNPRIQVMKSAEKNAHEKNHQNIKLNKKKLIQLFQRQFLFPHQLPYQHLTILEF